MINQKKKEEENEKVKTFLAEMIATIIIANTIEFENDSDIVQINAFQRLLDELIEKNANDNQKCTE